MKYCLKKLSSEKFLVTITSNLITKHKIYVDKDFYKKITNEKITKEKLVSLSVEFLLKKEDNSTILKSFELSVILDYFPDYLDFIKRNC